MKTQLTLGFLLLVWSCTPETNEIPEPEVSPTADEVLQRYFNFDLNDLPNYAAPDYPLHYAPPITQNDNTPAANQVSDLGATLGRVLFYDKNLSRNGTISCASCHRQELGFTDSEQFSMGFENGLTGAHSMRLGNASFYLGPQMFWDKRAADLEDQVTQPVKDHQEMGFDDEHGGMEALLQRMVQLEYYPILFERAFGRNTITEQNIRLALAQFIRSMVSVDSKFDQGAAQVFMPGQPNNLANASFPNFTAEENLGKSLFFNPPAQNGAGCAGCHQPPTFSLDANSLNNGLDAGETTIFKSPSLKNVGLSGPYMHDGRFATLQQVIEHYDNGIRPGNTLDNRLKLPNMNQPIRLNLTDQQKNALVAFLNTLSDPSLVMDEKFSDPFK